MTYKPVRGRLTPPLLYTHNNMTKQEETRHRIGKRIAELRMEQGLNQSQLAERCGLRQHHISRIENGTYCVGLDTLQTIAEALGTNVEL